MTRKRYPWRSLTITLFEMFRKHWRTDLTKIGNKRQLDAIVKRDFDLAKRVRETGKSQMYMDAVGKMHTMTKKEANEFNGIRKLYEGHGSKMLNHAKKLKSMNILHYTEGYVRNGKHVNGYYKYNYHFSQPQKEKLVHFIDSGGSTNEARTLFRRSYDINITAKSFRTHYNKFKKEMGR